MKLLTIGYSSIRYGAENHMLCVARGLAGHGVDVHAAFPCAHGTMSMIEDCKAAGISYWPFKLHSRFDPFPPKWSVSSNLQMLNLLRNVRPDVVQISAGVPHQVWPAAWSCALCNIPLLAVFQLAPKNFTIHSLKVKLLAWGRRRRQRWMAVSQENLSALQQTFGTSPGEIGVLYNGIEVAPEMDVQNEACTEALRREVRTELDASPNARLLLTTARLNVQKGHVDLLRILPKIINEFPDVVCVWAGDGPEQEVLEEQIHDQGLQKHVRVLGYRADVPRLVRASDLFVFPSHFEGGCSASIREAMAQSLPIVCSDAGGIPEVLQNGSHALMFKVRDTEGMLTQLRTALSSPAEMRTLAEQARQRILEFSSTRMIENYFAIFRDLCAEASTGEAR